MRKISFVDCFSIGVAISGIGSGLVVVGGFITDNVTEAIQRILGEGSASEASLIFNFLELSGLGAGVILLLEKINKASKCDRISTRAEAEED